MANAVKSVSMRGPEGSIFGRWRCFSSIRNGQDDALNYAGVWIVVLYNAALCGCDSWRCIFGDLANSELCGRSGMQLSGASDVFATSAVFVATILAFSCNEYEPYSKLRASSRPSILHCGFRIVHGVIG